MKNNNKGFSLVELIVVIAIMAILAAVAVVGVSVYIPKAQQANDEQLASDIEKGLDLYAQAGDLTPGDYVIVYLDKNAEFGNHKDETKTTMDEAMKGLYGANWQQELRLSYPDWEIGVVANSEMMGYVNNSSYSNGGLDNLLDRVQTVVNAAGNYLTGMELTNEQLVSYLDKAGVELDENNTVTAENSSAVANAAVFSAANTIVNSHTGNNEDFYVAWAGGAVQADDAVANNAATYSMVLAMATYIDAQTAGTDNATSYVSQIEVDDETLESNPRAILDSMNNVLTAMYADDSVASHRNTYLGLTFDEDGNATVDKNAQGYKDSMAFYAYMSGVEDSSDTMLENYDIYSDNFFGNGTMQNYVQNYVDAGAILSNLNISGDAFAFIYDGSKIVCVPLDY